MPKSVIKEEFKSTLIVFNGGGRKTLGEREDIDVLAIMALESQNPDLLKLFEELPTLDELKKSQVESQLKKSDAVDSKVLKARRNKVEQK